jgi:hypothetical protein
MFAATYMVSIKKWPNYDVKLPLNQQTISPDWLAVIDEVTFLSQTEYNRNAEVFRLMAERGSAVDVTEEQLQSMSLRSAPEPRAEVLAWLEANVANVKDADQPQGWCMGNRDYRYGGAVGELTFWFRRRRDAMAFIRRWSEHGKPTSYLNYFKDDYRELRDGKLTKVTR